MQRHHSHTDSGKCDRKAMKTRCSPFSQSLPMFHILPPSSEEQRSSPAPGTAKLSQALSPIHLSWHLFPQLLISLTFCNGYFALLCFSKQHSLDRLFPLNVLLCTNFKYSPQRHLHLCRHLPLRVELQSHFDQHSGSKSTLHSLISTEESSQKLGVDGGTFLLLMSHFCNVSVLMKTQSVVLEVRALHI